VSAVCGFAAAVDAARRLPCGARSAGRLRQLGPEYKASDTSKSSRGTAPTPLRCAPRRRRGAPPLARPRPCKHHRATRRRLLRGSSMRLVAPSRAAPSVPAEARVGGGCGASAAPSSAAQRGQSGAWRRTGEKPLWAGPVQGPEPKASQPPRGVSRAGEPARRDGRCSEAANAAPRASAPLRLRNDQDTAHPRAASGSSIFTSRMSKFSCFSR
jgi:hypothetical protein